MESTTPTDLVALLRSSRLRVRTGLWLVTLDLLGREPDEAARLGVDAVDVREPLLMDLPGDTHYVGLSVDRLVEILDRICNRNSGSDCILVYNFDLLLARLRHQERLDVWRHLYNAFPNRTRSLLVVMPQGADHLLPSMEALHLWRQDGRLVG